MISKIPPSIFNAYNICPRQAWLMSRQMTADQQNEYMGIGRFIDETSFQRDKKKIYLPDIGAMIDMATSKDGILFIAEIKKSSAMLETGSLQLKYYLYLLKTTKGIETKGILKIPKEKKSVEIELTNEDSKLIEQDLNKLQVLLNSEVIPSAQRLKICPKCAHFEFCWA